MPLIAPNVGRVIIAAPYPPFPQYWAYSIKSGISSALAHELDSSGTITLVRKTGVDWQALNPSLPALVTTAGAYANQWQIITPALPGGLVDFGSVCLTLNKSGSADRVLVVWDVEGEKIYFRDMEFDAPDSGGDLGYAGQPHWDVDDEKIYWVEVFNVDGTPTPPTVTVKLMRANADLSGVETFGTTTIPGGQFTMSETRFECLSINLHRGSTNTDVRMWGKGYDGLAQTQSYYEWIRFTTATGAFDEEEEETFIHGTAFGGKVSSMADPIGERYAAGGRLNQIDTLGSHVPANPPTETEIWSVSFGSATTTGLSIVVDDASLWDPINDRLISAPHTGTIPGSPVDDFTTGTAYSYVGLSKALP